MNKALQLNVKFSRVVFFERILPINSWWIVGFLGLVSALIPFCRMGRVDLQTYSHEDPKGQHQRPSQYLSKICSCWRASYGSPNPVLVGGFLIKPG